MHYSLHDVTNVDKFFDLADSIMINKLGFKRSAIGGSAKRCIGYHIYKKSLIDYNLKIKYTIVDNGIDLENIQNCIIKIKFIPSSNNKDTNGDETYDTIKYTITGFKIVGVKYDNLIIEPFGDKQEIDIYNKTANKRTITRLLKLDKSKQYLLPLDKEQLDKATILDNPFMEYNMEYKKSLLGLGCITGDEKSCCGCCYW